MQTDKAVAAYLTSATARNVSAKTLSNYKWALDYLKGNEQLPTEPYEVELVLAEATSHLGTESMFTLYRRIKDFFEWTGTRYEIPNPFLRANPYGSKPQVLIPPPVRPDTVPRIFNSDQVHQLLNVGARSARDRLLVLLPLDTGLRLAEIAALNKADVSPDLLRVKGKGRKSRDVPISKEVLHEIMYLGNAHSPWLSKSTGQPLTRWGVQLAYQRIFARATLTGAAHTLRHTFATMYLRRGGDIERLRRILGHSDLKTTMIYLHLVHDDLVQTHREVSPVHQFLSLQGRLL